MNHIFMQLEALPEVDTAEGKRGRLLDAAALISGAMAEVCSLAEDEVAILVLSDDGESLRFLSPRALYSSGSTFPVGTSSVAGSAVVYKRPSVNNEMSKVRNLSFFSRIKTGERSPLPIQKMLTAPIMVGDRMLGVIQLCRKSKTVEDVGPDFKLEDLDKMKELLTVLGVVIERDWSEDS